MRHMIDPLDFSVQEVENVLDLADSIAADPSRYREVCRYKKLATLFYEPSTRTRLSFEAAMLNLGGSVLGFSSADSNLVFGKETKGLPDELLLAHPAACVRIPMREEARSLNLSNSVAVAVYEGLRQNGFGALSTEDAEHRLDLS